MDRETLVKAIKAGPVMITMNDGSEYVIRSSEFAMRSPPPLVSPCIVWPEATF